MRFLAGGFKVDCGGVEQYFANLPGDVRERILDYELLVYVCDGDESEKLDWFRRINIAGEVLNDQELLNAVFSGPWLTAAKRWFSRPGSAAAGVSENYVKGVAIRQEYLATALRWIARRDATSVEGYMGAHAHDANANELQNCRGVGPVGVPDGAQGATERRLGEALRRARDTQRPGSPGAGDPAR